MVVAMMPALLRASELDLMPATDCRGRERPAEGAGAGNARVCWGGCDGAVAVGCVRDGSVRDGSVRDGSVRDGSVRDGSVRDGSVRDGFVRDGFGGLAGSTAG